MKMVENAEKKRVDTPRVGKDTSCTVRKIRRDQLIQSDPPCTALRKDLLPKRLTIEEMKTMSSEDICYIHMSSLLIVFISSIVNRFGRSEDLCDR
jgi:hypothetical protein